MDIVYLRGLRIDCVIGAYDWEREIRQTLVFDIEMGFDIRPAAASDALPDTLDYHAVALRVQELVGASSYQLVETLAEAIVGDLRTAFGLPWVRLRVGKPGAVPGAIEAGLLIERGARS